MPGTWFTSSNSSSVMGSSISGIPLPDTSGDIAQTFYLDPLSVLNSRYAFLTGIDLYFYGKPNFNGVVGTSGIPKPGVTITIVDTKLVNGVQVPDLDSPIKYSVIRKEWDEINVSTTGNAVTTFEFPRVPLETDFTYGIVVKFDGFDKGYSLWRNRGGETYNNITSPNITKGALDGYFFVLTNGTNLTTQADTDLKFALRVAKFQTTPTTYKVVNRNIEKLVYRANTMVGAFLPGEPVFANTGPVSGQTVAITAGNTVVVGTSTLFTSNFTVNGHIVIQSGNNSMVRKIVSISNNTLMTVYPGLATTNAAANYLITPVAYLYDHYPYGNTIVLSASTSNTTYNFSPNTTSNTIVGSVTGSRVTITSLESTKIDEFASDFKIFEPPGTSTNTAVYLANTTFSTVPTSYPVPMTNSGTKKRFNAFPALLFSRTSEVTQGNGSVGTLTNSKSVNFELTFKSDNPYASPHLDEEELKFHVYTRYVSNDLTNEHLSNGKAVSKYVTRTVTLAEGHDSEDMIVFVDAFRPQGTDVILYAKFFNPADPEAFQNKNWTRLEQTTPAITYSNKDNLNDLVEIRYGLPKYPIYDWNTKASGNTIQGSFSVAGTTNTIFTSTVAQVNNVTANGVQAGDLVRVYNPLFPNNSLISVVTTCNTTSMTLATTVSTANARTTEFVTSGMRAEKVEYKNTAYNNYVANGVVRYHNSSMAAFDTYRLFALKIVLTGTPGGVVYPYVDNIRGIAVSI